MSENAGGRPRKVPKLLGEYDLEGYGERLCELWTRETNRYSVRELEVKFNGKLIQAAVEAGGGEIDAATAEDYYRRLSGDNEETKAKRVRDRLGEFGIDTESLERDFVSYHAIYTYLRSRGATPHGEPDGDPETQLESTLEAADEYREAADEKLSPKLRQLSDAGVIPDDPPEVHVSLKVTCAYCGTVHPLRRYLTRQGCGCDAEDRPRLSGELDDSDTEAVSSLLKDGFDRDAEP
jgi:hypothetical protein